MRHHHPGPTGPLLTRQKTDFTYLLGLLNVSYAPPQAMGRHNHDPLRPLACRPVVTTVRRSVCWAEKCSKHAAKERADAVHGMAAKNQYASAVANAVL